MGALAVILGKAMGKKSGDDESSPDMGGDDEDESSPDAKDYAKEVFQAIKDDDGSAFSDALLGAIRCAKEDE